MNIDVCGKNVELASPLSVKECFLKAGFEICHDYEENPIVGAFYNGRAVSLTSLVVSSGELVPIRVFEQLGRRIYRHSICYLLAYASYLVFPNRRLVIGHSLGDGFFFSFSNDECSDESVAAIATKMEELASLKLNISLCRIPLSEATSYFENHCLLATSKLISFRNDPEIEVYQIEDYYDMAYEPIVDNTEILTKWELRPYQGKGMLLRYPVSSDVYNVCPNFRDKWKLFSVFEESKNWGKILGVSCVGEMNRKISDKTVDSYVRLAEALQRRKIASVADEVFKKCAKAVFIAGPSSSGKTTFAKKLGEQLQMLGCSTIRISLDDYYRHRSELPKNAKGEPDYECIEALRVEQFYSNMKDIFQGKEVFLPVWNFAKQEQTLRTEAVRLGKNTVFIIEGIHGLNPKIMDCVAEKDRFSVSISALTQLNLDDHNRVSTTDNRILRRIVRDYRTRAVSAVTTLSMWPDVERGERVQIFPFQNEADVMFNSALDYELGVLSPYVTPLLMEVGPQNKTAYAMARRLLAFLTNISAIPSKYVPSDSILREFIGDSDYE